MNQSCMKNIYANLQTNSKPCLMNFDLSNENYWDQFYDLDVESSDQSIQESILVYSSPNLHLALEVEVEIVDAVKSAIRGWRRVPSSFNADIGNRLRQLLVILEKNKMSTDLVEKTAPNYYQTFLNELGRGRTIFGLPLHSGFTNVPSLIERVRKIGIHHCKHTKVEFALAVQVFPYVCNVLSVWIYVCVIYPD